VLGPAVSDAQQAPVDDLLESPGAVVVADWLEAVIDSQKNKEEQ
jgi:hypothetical protein